LDIIDTLAKINDNATQKINFIILYIGYSLRNILYS